MNKFSSVYFLPGLIFFLSVFAVISFCNGQVISDNNREKKTSDLVLNSGISDIVKDRILEDSSRQRKIILAGNVEDGSTGEPVAGATIFIMETGSGMVADEYGKFKTFLSPSQYSIEVSAVSFTKLSFIIILKRDTSIIINLFPGATQLNEVVISDQATDHNVSELAMDVTRLDIKELTSIPPLLGEPDILKGLLLLPGVTSVGEGAAGLNVRGGNADQNLILLDDAPLYNPTHMFGFFSAINADAIKNVTLSKGGIPARYGGKVSSIIDIRTRQGNDRSFHAEGGLGILSSHLTLDGPLISPKTTFLISGRAAYSDWYMKLLPDNILKNSNADFQDVIVKITRQLNERNILSATGYFSRDRFTFPGDTVYGWETRNLTLSWSKYSGQKFYFINEFIVSHYDYTEYGGKPESAFTWKAGIENYNLKGDFTYNINQKNKTDFGYSVIIHRLSQGELTPRGDSSAINTIKLEPEHAIESGLYISHERIFSEKIAVMAGLRYSLFFLMGPGTINQYEAEQPVSLANKNGTQPYDAGEIISTYDCLEPRFSFRYILNKFSSIKVNYNRTCQYIHLISNTAAISPVDIWQLSGPYLKPQTGHQVSAGYFRNSNSDLWETSVEVYYKHISNVVDYRNGADLVLNPHIETELAEGLLRSYGIELSLKKTKGKFTGMVSYTLSRSERKVDNTYMEETVNFGRFYPASYDKLHDFSLTGNYRFNSRFSFAFNFIFNSGRPITYPTGSYEYFGSYIPNYELRNQERTPIYHRLDIGFTLEGSHKNNRKWHGSFTVSVYNLYGRKNPYSIFFNAVGYKLPQAYRLAIIGVPIPSLTYNFKFY